MEELLAAFAQLDFVFDEDALEGLHRVVDHEEAVGACSLERDEQRALEDFEDLGGVLEQQRRDAEEAAQVVHEDVSAELAQEAELRLEDAEDGLLVLGRLLQHLAREPLRAAEERLEELQQRRGAGELRDALGDQGQQVCEELGQHGVEHRLPLDLFEDERESQGEVLVFVVARDVELLALVHELVVAEVGGCEEVEDAGHEQVQELGLLVLEPEVLPDQPHDEVRGRLDRAGVLVVELAVVRGQLDEDVEHFSDGFLHPELEEVRLVRETHDQLDQRGVEVLLVALEEELVLLHADHEEVQQVLRVVLREVAHLADDQGEGFDVRVELFLAVEDLLEVLRLDRLVVHVLVAVRDVVQHAVLADLEEQQEVVLELFLSEDAADEAGEVAEAADADHDFDGVFFVVDDVLDLGHEVLDEVCGGRAFADGDHLEEGFEGVRGVLLDLAVVALDQHQQPLDDVSLLADGVAAELDPVGLEQVEALLDDLRERRGRRRG